MIETLNESEQYMTNDSRVRTSVNTFLTHFMEKYMLDFDFQIDELFGPVNKPIIRKINFLNMTDVAIENLSEIELREGLNGRGVEFEENIVMNGDSEEHIKEVAQVLSSYCDCIAIRAFPQFQDWEHDRTDYVINSFAKYSSVPVVNMETIEHPCQELAHILTLQELTLVSL